MRGVALEGVDRLRSRENNYSILLRYMMAHFIFFFYAGRRFYIKSPQDDYGSIKTGRPIVNWNTQDNWLSLQNSQSVFLYILFANGTRYVYRHPNARSARLKFVVTAMEENVDHAYCGFWYAQKVRGWRGMWLSLVKKKALLFKYSNGCTLVCVITYTGLFSLVYVRT